MYIATDIEIRLVDGPTRYEGRVEVYYNGEWGTVCDDGWDLNDAKVVCRQLGFGSVVAVRKQAYYGQGSGQVWLDELNCVGTELTIKDCPHNEWGYQDCFHGEDAGIECSGTYIILAIYMYVYKVCMLACVYVCMYVCTVFICIEARAFISY